MSEEMDALYRRLPFLKCKGLCSESCGPVFMSAIEWQRIIERLGYEPKGDETLRCPMLKGNSCIVYDIRPMICRLWGMAKPMRCPWACVPAKWITRPAAHGLLAEAERISAEHGIRVPAAHEVEA